MLFLYAIVCGLVAAPLIYCLNWWSLRAWRKAAHEHWTERARLLFPARNGAAIAVVYLPLIAVIVRVGGRIYAGALLRTGGRTKMREALKAERA